jgi:ribosomal protein S27AE
MKMAKRRETGSAVKQSIEGSMSAQEKNLLCPNCGALLWRYLDGRETCSRCEYEQRLESSSAVEQSPVKRSVAGSKPASPANPKSCYAQTERDYGLDYQMQSLLLTSSCFGREVCQFPPCACAKSLADLATKHSPAPTEHEIALAIYHGDSDNAGFEPDLESRAYRDGYLVPAQALLRHFDIRKRPMMTEPYRISCAICGKACKWVEAAQVAHAGGWYCARCDAFTETDIEVED